MKTLRELLDGMDYELVKGSLDVPVGDIIYDSRKECRGDAFVCICGTKIDSHDFIPDVAARGAAAVVIEREVPVEADITVVRVPSARRALAELSAAYFDHPTRKMTTIGLTGTKGKTTSTYMLKAILEAAGKKVGLVGTNGAVIAGEHFTTNNTTPESYELQQYFHRMVEAGCEYMIMEVSSQGLMMDRVAGIHFDIGIFTNITPDHIGPGEHSSFEEYRAWKGELFKRCEIGIVNRDDPNCEALLAGHTCAIRTFGQKEEDDFRATEIRHLQNGSFMGVSFMLSGKYGSFPVEVGIPGLFSVYNALGALGAALTLGISQEAILSALKSIRVNGRMELVYASDRFSVIVDYAHNGVSTRSLLETLRDYNPKRLVVVFGCGGNRDPHRRYEMGEVAGEMADLSIVTADNSRFEKVEDIIADIHIGLDPTGGAFVDIPDRREAIRYSIEQAQPGDVIAIIGKGHEDYQEVCGVKTHFSDREEAEAVLRELAL
ncbi:MAG: UDP-N-acetylmuramoyl-L-alanyl-D-glutamate--2,6-diaminopimelate ligase [Lachnospiraceae bacterium]|nr:UDP-N-acetylmuramoyl-L-alanyl-D-glutamate--2,6-diaminopimelate ligase [Lachnospiraceae bacterium]